MPKVLAQAKVDLCSHGRLTYLERMHTSRARIHTRAAGGSGMRCAPARGPLRPVASAATALLLLCSHAACVVADGERSPPTPQLLSQQAQPAAAQQHCSSRQNCDLGGRNLSVSPSTGRSECCGLCVSADSCAAAVWPVRPDPLVLRRSLCAAPTLLKCRRSAPGHAIAAIRAIKSSLLAVAGGKGA